VVVNSATGLPSESFEDFASSTGERVRRALVAYYGVEIGTEAAADAMSVAWERWAEIAPMANAAGYLFRVGQSKARPHVRWARRSGAFPTVERAALGGDADLVDLLAALGRLRPAQRAAVVLVKSYGFSYREVADLLGVAETTVTNHVHRGLGRLRSMLEVQ
jgi:DNA-directed RNA polymerase specialized sigma24 family protein